MKISVIIPTLNEEKYIGELIQALIRKSDPNRLLEVLVIDGQSTDRTVEVAKLAGAVVYESQQRGRAAQLSLGGERARGDVLYFLHADTQPPKAFDKIIEKAVNQGCLAGCFQVRFEPSTRFLRFFEGFVKLPWMVSRGGDQSLYVTRELYSRIGGFNPTLKIMEDIEIIRRIRRETAFHILSHHVVTSSRKYQRQGAWRLQMLYAWIHLQYWLGVSTDRIYDNSKKWVQKN